MTADHASEERTRESLRRHNRALAELVATRTELVSAMLHELRTPLASALAMIELLPATTGDPQLDEALELIGRNVRRIAGVTERIATISGLENGTLPIERAEFDLAALLAEHGFQVAAETSAETFAEAGPEASAEAGPEASAEAGPEASAETRGGTGAEAGLFVGDRELLGQVFGRLAEAVRALGGVPTGGEATMAGDHWRIALRLPPDLVTDRLFTGANATALMFARAVAGRHGGTVGVQGGSLVVSLPRSARPPGSADPAR